MLWPWREKNKMKSTLITEDNAHLFIEGVPKDVQGSADLLLGAIDEETDTACGVLAAAVDDDNSVQITFIYVAEKFRRKGAGTELIKTLQEIAADNRSSEISCVHTKTAISDGVYELLEKCGFVLFDLATVKTYEVRAGDVYIPGPGLSYQILPVSDLTKAQWRDLSEKVSKLEKQDETGWVLPLRDIEGYDKKHSFVSFSEDGKMTGALLVSASAGVLSIDGLYSFGRNEEKLKEDLVAAAKEAVEEDLSEDTVVLMCPYTDEQLKEMDRICGGKEIKREETVVQILSL